MFQRRAIITNVSAIAIYYQFQKAGISYGLLPKMVRSQKLHQFLWYLCYETHGKNMEPIQRDDNGESKKRVETPSSSSTIEKVSNIHVLLA